MFSTLWILLYPLCFGGCNTNTTSWHVQGGKSNKHGAAPAGRFSKLNICSNLSLVKLRLSHSCFLELDKLYYYNMTQHSVYLFIIFAIIMAQRLPVVWRVHQTEHMSADEREGEGRDYHWMVNFCFLQRLQTTSYQLLTEIQLLRISLLVFDTRANVRQAWYHYQFFIQYFSQEGMFLKKSAD